MSKHPKLSVQARTITGRKVKQLRLSGIIPANVFGKKTKSVSVQVKLDQFQPIFREVGETGLVDLTLEDESKARPVLIANIHRDPLTDQLLHVDFHQVDLTQKVTAAIPVELIGESPAVKELGGVLNQTHLELEVEALPDDLPDKIEINLATLTQIGSNVFAKDLKLPPQVALNLDPETLLISVIEPKVEEEVVEAPPAETETTVQGAPESTEEAAKPEPEAKGE